MKIVLDTNIIYQDFHLNGQQFRILLDNLHKIPATIHFPEIVIDEITTKFRERLEDLANKAQSTCAELARIRNRKFRTSYPKVNLDSEGDQYEKFLRSKIEEHKIQIVPYPKVPHKEIVQRELSRKKPFQSSGTGYRDFLIWQCVKNLMLWGSEKIILVTNNKRDFGGGRELHEDLKKDVINPDQFQIYTSLSELNAELVLPKLEREEEIKQLLQENKLDQFDLYKWVQQNLLKLLRENEIGNVLLGFPHGAGSFWPSEITNMREIKVLEVANMESGDKLITALVDMEFELSIDINGEDCIHYPELEDRFGFIGRDSFMSTIWLIRAQTQFSLIVEKNTYAVVSSEIKKIESDHGNIVFQP